jgi:hypothetical protein
MCATVGPQDCNPNRTPGGFFCCLSEFDAGEDAEAAAFDGSEIDADAASDGDANACTVDSSETACCCDGDVGGRGPFCSGGALSCETGFGLYFGADCTRECGPCAVACPDSGTSGADAGMDGSTEGGLLDADGE